MKQYVCSICSYTYDEAKGIPEALSVAVKKSSRLMAEYLCREAGYMLPQSGNT